MCKVSYTIKYGTGYHPSTEFSFIFNKYINTSNIVTFMFSPSISLVGVVETFKLLTKNSGRFQYHKDLEYIQKSNKSFNIYNDYVNLNKKVFDMTYLYSYYAYKTNNKLYNKNQYIFSYLNSRMCSIYKYTKYLYNYNIYDLYIYDSIYHASLYKTNNNFILSDCISLAQTIDNKLYYINTNLNVCEVDHYLNLYNYNMNAYRNNNGLFNFLKISNIQKSDNIARKDDNISIFNQDIKINLNNDIRINYKYIYSNLYINKSNLVSNIDNYYDIILNNDYMIDVNEIHLVVNNYQYMIYNFNNGIIKNKYQDTLFNFNTDIITNRYQYMLYNNDNDITKNTYNFFVNNNSINVNTNSNYKFINIHSNNLSIKYLNKFVYKDKLKSFKLDSVTLNKYNQTISYVNSIVFTNKANYKLNVDKYAKFTHKIGYKLSYDVMLQEISKASIMINNNDNEKFISKYKSSFSFNDCYYFLTKYSQNIFISNQIFIKNNKKYIDILSNVFLTKSNNSLSTNNFMQLFKGNSYIYSVFNSLSLYKDKSYVFTNESLLLKKDKYTLNNTFLNLIVKKDGQYLNLNNVSFVKKNNFNAFLQYDNYLLSKKSIKFLKNIDLSVSEIGYDTSLNYDLQLYKLQYKTSLSNNYINFTMSNKQINENTLTNKHIHKGEKDIFSTNGKFLYESNQEDIYINETDRFGWVRDFLPPMEFIKDAIDELLLPKSQFDYSDHKNEIIQKNYCINKDYLEYIDEDNNPVISLAIEQPVPYYVKLAEDYVDVDVLIMREVLEILYHYWRKYIHSFVGMDPAKAVNRILVSAHDDVLARFNRKPNNHRLYDAERSLKLFAWYCEMTILTQSLKKLNMKKANATFDFGAGFIPTFNEPLHEVRALTDDDIVAFHNFYLDSKNCTIRRSYASEVSTIQISHLCQFHDTKLTCIAYITNGVLEITTSDNVYIYNRGGTYKIDITLPKDNNGFRLVFRKNDFGSGYIEIAQFLIHDRYNISYNIEYLSQVKNINYTIQYILDFLGCAGDAIDDTNKILEKVSPPANALEKFREYMALHHEKKLKGKRLTIMK